MCPHTSICVLILGGLGRMQLGRPGEQLYVPSYYDMCALILRYVCPHTTICVPSYYDMCVLILRYMCPHTTTCVLILRYMCPHTTIYVSSYYYMCPHTAIYVPSYYDICVLILLLHICPHTTMYMFLHQCIRVLIFFPSHLYVSSYWAGVRERAAGLLSVLRSGTVLHLLCHH
jgi:hypothetical protein